MHSNSNHDIVDEIKTIDNRITALRASIRLEVLDAVVSDDFDRAKTLSKLDEKLCDADNIIRAGQGSLMRAIVAEKTKEEEASDTDTIF